MTPLHAPLSLKQTRQCVVMEMGYVILLRCVMEKASIVLKMSGFQMTRHVIIWVQLSAGEESAGAILSSVPDYGEELFRQMMIAMISIKMVSRPNIRWLDDHIQNTE